MILAAVGCQSLGIGSVPDACSFSPSGRHLCGGGTTVRAVKQQRPDVHYVSTTLCLLGGPFVVKHGQRLEIPEGSKRLLMFVALTGGRVNRRHAAGTLWH